jgi:hypothetical protein
LGKRVPPEFLGRRRNGVVVVSKSGDVLVSRATVTRRRARQVFDVLRRVADRRGALPPSFAAIYRVERRSVVEEKRVQAGDAPPGGEGPPDAGTREPRRPHPSSGGATAVQVPPGES